MGLGQRSLRSEEHTSELQSRRELVCRLLLEKKKKNAFSPFDAEKKKTTTARIPLRTTRPAGSALTHHPPRPPKGSPSPLSVLFFFFNDTATTEIYTLSLHDALPI